MGDKNTPSWVKKRVRARQAETGEKYTQALREVRKEMEEEEKRNDAS